MFQNPRGSVELPNAAAEKFKQVNKEFTYMKQKSKQTFC